MTIYIYDQNNSFGRYDISTRVGHVVLIEAEGPEQADKVAREKADIYFDGVSAGIDCKCCGDRWHPTDEWYAVPTEQEALDRRDIGAGTVIHMYRANGEHFVLGKVIHVYRANGEHVVLADTTRTDAELMKGILADPCILFIDTKA